jgi:signal transduction histidine kinase
MHAGESQIYNSIIIAIAVIGLVIFYFFYSLFRQNKNMREIERKNADAQIKALETDRARIAADLHDDLAPMLASVRMKINSFDLTNAGDGAVLEKTNSTIDDITARMRAISFDLMPSTLQDKGLQVAIQQFVNFVAHNNPLQVRFITPKENIHIEDQKAIHLYRIVQEIIHNTMKHAKATELTILLTKEKHYLVLSTKDNGMGFDYRQQIKESSGLGLKSLMNRIYLLKAEFSIDSKPGKGTSITIQIPDNE